MELLDFRSLMIERIRSFDKYVQQDMKENREDWAGEHPIEFWEEHFKVFCS